MTTSYENVCAFLYQEARLLDDRDWVRTVELRRLAVGETMTLEPHAKRIRMPFLCVAGERDELCPVEWAYRTLDAMPS